MNNIDVSIILVNYNNSNVTINAIDSVIKNSSGFSYEIIVVDNSNNIEEFNRLEKLCADKALCINSNDNLGFGKGNNLGVLHSNGKYVYFLNNDTLLINNAIFELYKFLEDNDNVGIVGSNLYSFENKPYHSFCKYEYDLTFAKKEYSLCSILKRNLFKRNDFNYSQKPMKLDGYVCGASLMMSRKNFDKLGGFDKDIFMYAEETLLCYKLRHELKLEIFNVPTSKIIHLEGMSFKSNQEAKPSSWRTNTMVNGTSVYLIKAYGKDECINYWKYMIKVSKKKIKLCKLLHKSNYTNYEYMISACETKINELLKAK